MSGVGVAGPPVGVAGFVKALAEAVDCATRLQEALFRAIQKVPGDDPAAWIATMTDPRVADELGSLAMLCDGIGAGVHGSIGNITKALSGAAPAETIDAFAAGLVRGMTQVAMTCGCGACGFCETRRVDPANAEQTIAAELAKSVVIARPKSQLVGPNGRRIRL